MLAIEKKQILINTLKATEKAFQAIEEIDEEELIKAEGYEAFEDNVRDIYNRLDTLWGELTNKIKENKFEDDLEEDEYEAR